MGFSLPMRDGNTDAGLTPDEYFSFSLPMRDGNVEQRTQIGLGLRGFSLPIRDGNIPLCP